MAQGPSSRCTSIRAVLLRSEGKLFCAGGDIGGFSGAGDKVPDLISEETAYLHVSRKLATFFSPRSGSVSACCPCMASFQSSCMMIRKFGTSW
jgi:hypothetical protein